MPSHKRQEKLARTAAVVVAQSAIAKDMAETTLQANTIELAEALGYTVIHIRDSRRQQAEGLPDLLIGGHGRLIYAELKREPAASRHTDLSPWQVLWRDIILGANHEWYLWHPSDWLDGTVERILKGTQP